MKTPLCVDNYGEEVFLCDFSDKPFPISELKYTGKLLRQAVGPAFIGNTDEAKQARMNSVIAYDDMDRNCNACSNIIRDKTERVKSFELRTGRCKIIPFEIKYHPDDYMGMPCFSNVRSK